MIEVGNAKKRIEFRNTRPRPGKAAPAGTGEEV
jgi:3-oxoacid CoA-transferase subunit A